MLQTHVLINGFLHHIVGAKSIKLTRSGTRNVCTRRSDDNTTSNTRMFCCISSSVKRDLDKRRI